MLTKAEFLASLARECAITKHLVTKLDAGHLDHRLTESQRSIGELLEYLAIHLEGGVAFFLQGNWDRWTALEEGVNNLRPSAFAAAMDKQFAAVETMLLPITDRDLAQRMIKTFSGDDMLLGDALLEYTLKHAVSYKMQLFLQAKHAGLLTLSSDNLWRGRDTLSAVS